MKQFFADIVSDIACFFLKKCGKMLRWSNPDMSTIQIYLYQCPLPPPATCFPDMYPGGEIGISWRDHYAEQLAEYPMKG